MNSADQDKKESKREVFQPINPNMHSSGALARERFKRALSLNPAQTPEQETLRESLTEHEEH